METMKLQKQVTASTMLDPKILVPAIRSEIRRVDDDVLLEEVTVVEQSLRTSVAPQRFNMTLVLAFATLALTLAAVGTV